MGWVPGEHGLLMWLELVASPAMCHHRGFLTSVFNLVSRDPLVVAAPQEHPSCLVLQVRMLGDGAAGEVGSPGGAWYRARAGWLLFLSIVPPTWHLGIRDLVGRRP